MTWIRQHPVKFTASVITGAVLAVLAFIYVTVAGAFAEASEEFDSETAADVLVDRTPDQMEQSVEEFLASQVDRLREEYRHQLEGQALDDEVERQIEQLTIEIRESREQVPNAVSPPLPDEMFTSILLIGADASGYLSDVMINVLLPADGSAPILVSLPRDLYVPNACTGTPARLNVSLGGCKGFATGSELLAINVESFTGIHVDHYARVNFEGFAALVDRLGGVQICVGDREVRDIDAHLEPIGPGCLWVDGATSLGWVRSRNPEYLEGEEWISGGGSDFTRQRRQQDVLFQFAERLSRYSSVPALTDALNNLSSVVRMDSGMTVGKAASLGFKYRSLDRDDVVRLRLDVSDARTTAGARVLMPDRTFNEILGAAYPPALVP